MKNKKILIAGVIVIIMVLILISFFKKEETPIELLPSEKTTENSLPTVPYEAPENASKITGLACDNYEKRAFAVMYSGDSDARKYFSNLSQADLVLEMPHRAVHGDPRLMGVFQCNAPDIVGPMRSGRVDNISIAGSFDAIFVPWGGSSIAKALLKKDVIDHIDCNGEVAPSGGMACFRRSGPMSQMNKASTNVIDLIKVAEQVGYRKESNFKGYAHQGDLPLDQRPEYARVRVKFEGTKSINAEYLYNRATNSYLRSLNGKQDIDYATGKQYAPKNLITIITKKDTWLLETDYVSQGLQDPWDGVDDEHSLNDSGGYPNMQFGDPWFDTKYEGEATFYLNGGEIKGTWKRAKGLANKYEFFDNNGDEIKFTPGQIWMHVLGHDQKTSYEDDAEEAARELLEEEPKKGEM
jgi:hypothetical protein